MPNGTRRPRTAAWRALAWPAAALLLAAGYAALWRGSTAAAALLLVVGYVAAVPAALLAGRPAPAGERAP